MAQLQCPNCGGYRAVRFRGMTFMAAIFWGVVLGGLPLLVTIPWYLVDKLRSAGNPWFRHGYRCELCGYEWLQRPGENLPVTVRPDLIRTGTQRVRKEEQDLADGWYVQQQKQRH